MFKRDLKSPRLSNTDTNTNTNKKSPCLHLLPHNQTKPSKILLLSVQLHRPPYLPILPDNKPPSSNVTTITPVPCAPWLPTVSTGLPFTRVVSSRFFPCVDVDVENSFNHMKIPTDWCQSAKAVSGTHRNRRGTARESTHRLRPSGNRMRPSSILSYPILPFPLSLPMTDHSAGCQSLCPGTLRRCPRLRNRFGNHVDRSSDGLLRGKNWSFTPRQAHRERGGFGQGCLVGSREQADVARCKLLPISQLHLWETISSSEERHKIGRCTAGIVRMIWVDGGGRGG